MIKFYLEKKNVSLLSANSQKWKHNILTQKDTASMPTGICSLLTFVGLWVAKRPSVTANVRRVYVKRAEVLWRGQGSLG